MHCHLHTGVCVCVGGGSRNSSHFSSHNKATLWRTNAAGLRHVARVPILPPTQTSHSLNHRSDCRGAEGLLKGHCICFPLFAFHTFPAWGGGSWACRLKRAGFGALGSMAEGKSTGRERVHRILCNLDVKLCQREAQSKICGGNSTRKWWKWDGTWKTCMAFALIWGPGYKEA